MTIRWIDSVTELLRIVEMNRADAAAIVSGVSGLDLMEVAMRRFFVFSVIPILLFAPQTAPAQTVSSEENPVQAERVFVVVNDGVTGGCLLKPNALKIEAEQILQQSGFLVIGDNDQADFRFSISPKGGPFGNVANSCIGAVAIQLTQIEPLGGQRFGTVLALQNGNTITGPKPGFESRLRQSVGQQVSALTNQFLKGRVP